MQRSILQQIKINLNTKLYDLCKRICKCKGIAQKQKGRSLQNNEASDVIWNEGVIWKIGKEKYDLRFLLEHNSDKIIIFWGISVSEKMW